jgi:hypothetical protein
MEQEIKSAYNTGLAKVAVQCSADTFVVNQNLVLRINLCGENRHLRQPENVGVTLKSSLFTSIMVRRFHEPFRLQIINSPLSSSSATRMPFLSICNAK